MKGLDVFKNYFQTYSEHYVLIGGAACDPNMPPLAAQTVLTKIRKNKKMKFQWISFFYSSQTRLSLT